MSAMDQMFANMIKNALPPEIVALMSPENIQAFGEKINNYLLSQAQFQENVSTVIVSIIDKLNIIEGKIDNVNCNGSNRDSSRSARRSQPK